MVLIMIFLGGGILLILLGLIIWRRLWDSGSVEVDAECIVARRPVYHYYYEGKHYEVSPLLAPNRPDYDPVFGGCRVRINRKHPEKMYSPERKSVSQILIMVGFIWIIIAVLLMVILPV